MSRTFLAAIFDLDGVITDTADAHARAWKAVVDPLLVQPFDVREDYRAYVAGRSRIEGVREFLASRSITLPHGELQSLAEHKNRLYLQILETEGVRVNPEMVARMALYAAAGLKIGIASGSKNARKVLALANLICPGVLVDGNDIEALGLRSKPAPDVFAHTARLLGVKLEDCLVFEDSPDAIAQIAPAHGVLVKTS